MITNDNGRRVFALEIGGLNIRYLSDSVDMSTTNLDANLTTGVSYTNLEGIVGVSAYQASIDPAGGIANYSPVTVSLGIDRFRGGLNDPHVIFGRCGPRAADITKAQIGTNIYHNTTSIIINVDQDFSSLTFPRVFHIGAETVRATGATSTTLSIDTRGVGRTPKQNHIITQSGTNIPEVITEIVSFRGRKASLYMAQKRPDGSISPFTEIINGFIDSSPSIEESAVSLSLVPLTALIDNELSETALETGLVHNYHNFDDLAGSKFEYAVVCKDSDFFRLTGSTGSPNLSVLPADQPIDHFQTFDASLTPASTGSYFIHPRYPEMTNFTGGRLFPESMTANTFSFDNGNASYNTAVPGNSSTFRVKVVTPRGEIKSFKINSGVQRFPSILNDVIDANTNNLTTGTNGAFAQFKINDDHSFMIRSNTNKETAETVIVLYSSKNALRIFEYHNGISTPSAIYNDTISGIYPTQDIERLWYPLDIWSEGRPFPIDPIDQEGSLFSNRAEFAEVFTTPILKNQTKKTEINGIALGFYQNGESTILVKDNLGLPNTASAGVYYDLEVVYYDRNLEQEASQTFQITHQTTATYSGADIGFLLHLQEPYTSNRRKSFGDWEGFEPAKIYLSTRINFLSPGQAILRLLQSGGGSSINGDYDQSLLGLNIDEIEIDINSFLQYESIPNLMINLDLRSEGQDFRKILTPLLQAMGAVLVMRRNENGRSKIALQPIGMEQSAAAALTINQGDWIADNPPSWDTYEDIVTQVEVNFDYDVIEQKLRTKRVFNNQEAINRYSGEKSKITLDLFGVSSDQIGGTGGDSFSFFLPVISRIFNLLSNPLRLWRGSIGTGQSALVDIGRYTLVNSDRLKGYDVDYGVTNGIGLIKTIRQELMGEGCELEILTVGTRSTSWNDSAKVLSVPTSTTVTIDQDVFSNTDLLGESVKDSNFFKVGDPVDYVLEGNHDSSITGLIIDSIVDNGSTATITFTAAHTIASAGGTLEPSIYTSASVDQKIDAYISNSSGILGTADKGKEYS